MSLLSSASSAHFISESGIKKTGEEEMQLTSRNMFRSLSRRLTGEFLNVCIFVEK